MDPVHYKWIEWRLDKVKADMQTVLAQFVDCRRRVQNSRDGLKQLP
jgi:hypothetical protein